MTSAHDLMTAMAASVSGNVCLTQAQQTPPVTLETVTVGNSGATRGIPAPNYDEMAEALSSVLRRPMRHVKEPRDHRR